jgi:ABC-type arginine transport system ATPase subunit
MATASAGDPAPDIVLIGPTGVGKTTVARLLAERLSVPHVSITERSGPYFAELGLTPARYRQIEAEQGFLAVYRHWWPGYAHVVERVLTDHAHGIIDLGAAHTHYEDPQLFDRIRRVLAPYAHVVLLLPAPDSQRSIQILRARSEVEQGWGWAVDGYDFIAHWVADPGNAELATVTVYTDGRTPAETCAEILTHVQRYAPMPRA